MGYIDEEYALELKSMAGFRKVLVHLYYQVDDGKVGKHLKEDLHLIEDFLAVVKKVIA